MSDTAQSLRSQEGSVVKVVCATSIAGFFFSTVIASTGAAKGGGVPPLAAPVLVITVEKKTRNRGRTNHLNNTSLL